MNYEEEKNEEACIQCEIYANALNMLEDQYIEICEKLKPALKRLSALKEENKGLKCCGNCKHGKQTSLDDTRCFYKTPYTPTHRHYKACENWERAELVGNTEQALK